MIVTDHLGNEVRVFARDLGGRVQGLIRCADRATFEAAAIARGLMVEITEPETDPETGEVTQVGTGTYRYAHGVECFDEGQTPVKAPAVLDDEGNVVAPAVVDTRYHARLVISEPALSQPDDHLSITKTVVTLIMWTEYGEVDQDVNTSEVAHVLSGVALIDPETVLTPLNVSL